MTEIMRRPAQYMLALLTGVVPAAAQAQTLKSDEVLSTIGVQAVARPEPVLGADNRIHLAYEWSVTNTSPLFITLDKVAAVDPAGQDLGALAGDGLAKMMITPGGKTGTRLPPGTSAFVLMDTSFPAGARVPETIAARITLTRQPAGPDGKPAKYPAAAPVPATVQFTGPAIAVGKQAAVLVDPPLRGPGWVAANGCCDALTSHRGAIMAINGVQRAGQRFAIDWQQLSADGRIFHGDKARLESYPYFGAPIYAVADGTVVNLYDQAPEQVPGTVAGVTPKDIGGNMLVIDIGGGRFAFFAHLKPGSLLVKRGDHVKRGQLIAHLGNTGNSDSPHLHFHIMDGPSPLNANGLPYVFSNFHVSGALDEATVDNVFENGAPATIRKTTADGDHKAQLPLNLEVINFPNERQAP